MYLQVAVTSMISSVREGAASDPCKMKGGVLAFRGAPSACRLAQSLTGFVEATPKYGSPHARIAKKNFIATGLLDLVMAALHQLKMGRPRADARMFAPPESLRYPPLSSLANQQIISLIACPSHYGTS
jgi:hypothetical protein